MGRNRRAVRSDTGFTEASERLILLLNPGPPVVQGTQVRTIEGCQTQVMHEERNVIREERKSRRIAQQVGTLYSETNLTNLDLK